MSKRATRDLSRAQQRIFIVLAIVFGLSVPFLLVEIGLRIFPVVPPPKPLDIVIEPGGKYQAPDPELGFTPLPGRYKALFDQGYTWNITNLQDTTRITKPIERYAEDAPRPGLWIFGCSFTQGWGLNDEDTIAWKMQERFPGYDVVNFGVGGYGTLQSLLQFRRALKEKPAPEVAVLVYADFHDERNVRTAAWRDANFSYTRFGTTAQPYARLDWSGNLRYAWGDGDVPLMALRARSKVIDMAAIGFGRMQEKRLHQHRVSELLIEEFAAESSRHGVRFVLAGIYPSDGTLETLRHFAAQGMPTVDISTNQLDQRNLIPFDGHPSAFANEQTADKLAAALR